MLFDETDAFGWQSNAIFLFLYPAISQTFISLCFCFSFRYSSGTGADSCHCHCCCWWIYSSGHSYSFFPDHWKVIDTDAVFHSNHHPCLCGNYVAIISSYVSPAWKMPVLSGVQGSLRRPVSLFTSSQQIKVIRFFCTTLAYQHQLFLHHQTMSEFQEK